MIYEQQVIDLPLAIIADTQQPALFGQNWLEGIKLNWMELRNIQSHKMLQLSERNVLLFQEKIGTIQERRQNLSLRKPDQWQILCSQPSVRNWSAYSKKAYWNQSSTVIRPPN